MVKIIKISAVTLLVSLALVATVLFYAYLFRTWRSHEEAIIDHEERIQALEEAALDWESSQHSM